jgi:hypothetical protein
MTHESKFGILNLWVFLICFTNSIQIHLNLDFSLLRKEINQYIWSLFKALWLKKWLLHKLSSLVLPLLLPEPPHPDSFPESSGRHWSWAARNQIYVWLPLLWLMCDFIYWLFYSGDPMQLLLRWLPMQPWTQLRCYTVFWFCFYFFKFVIWDAPT